MLSTRTSTNIHKAPNLCVIFVHQEHVLSLREQRTLPSSLALRFLMFGAFYIRLSNNDCLAAQYFLFSSLTLFISCFILSCPTHAIHADEIENLKLEQTRLGLQCADAQRREKILMRRLANKEQEFQDYVVSYMSLSFNFNQNIVHFTLKINIFKFFAFRAKLLNTRHNRHQRPWHFVLRCWIQL